MKILLALFLTVSSLSVFSATALNCQGGTIKILDNFSYVADKVYLQQEVVVPDNGLVMIYADKVQMRLLDNLYEAEGGRGNIVFILTGSRDANNRPLPGLNLFNTIVQTDEISDMRRDLRVKSANQYPGTDFALIDVEKGLFLTCVKK